jgi:ferredoxin
MSPVQVEVKDEEGKVIGSYEAMSQDSLLEGAEKQGIEIPSSCRS